MADETGACFNDHLLEWRWSCDCSRCDGTGIAAETSRLFVLHVALLKRCPSDLTIAKYLQVDA